MSWRECAVDSGSRSPKITVLHSVVFMNAAQSLANTLTATLASLDGVAGTMRGLATT